jgi:hypothetical protein
MTPRLGEFTESAQLPLYQPDRNLRTTVHTTTATAAYAALNYEVEQVSD